MSALYEELDYEVWLAGSTESARVAVPLIMDALSPRSVVDVGCGLGAWLAVFKEHAVEDVYGYDGPWVDRSKLLVAPGEFEGADLRKPLVAERRFDLSLCLEVAHVLEPEHAKPLVASLTALGEIVVFSAGIPGQGGSTQLNEQWPGYWAALFASHGYVATDPFREALWEQPDVKWWFAQNMLAFAPEEALNRLPTLAGARCDAAPRRLVHPGCLRQRLDDLEALQAQRPRRRLWQRTTT